LDAKIQTCHGFQKYFENALDDANVDHEKKMIIEGHFAGTRPKHYADSDVEQLRDVYRKAYPFIRLGVDELGQQRMETDTYGRRLTGLEIRLDKQQVLEAKITVLEGELDQMKQFHKRLEKQAEA